MATNVSVARALTRFFRINYHLARKGLSPGPRAQEIERELINNNIYGTKGSWESAPKTRIANSVGPGATYQLLSQTEGEGAFEGFASGVNRNAVHVPKIYQRLGTEKTENVETNLVHAVGGDLNKIEAVAIGSGQSANFMALKMLSFVGPAKEQVQRRISEGAEIPTELLKSHHGIIAPKGGIYGCTFDMLRREAEREGRDVHLLDLNDGDLVRETLKANPHIKTIFCEGLNNPNITLVDIKELARIRNEINEEMGYEGIDKIKLVADLTFTPIEIRPFEWEKELQPDLVTISATKSVGGGGRMSGFIIGDRKYIAGAQGSLAFRKDIGPVMDDTVADDLLISGLPSLIRRTLLSGHNAMDLANAFSEDDRVTVIYPGLASHPQHDIAQDIMRGYDGEFSPSHMMRLHLNPPPGFKPDVIEKIAQRFIDRIAKKNYGLLYAVSLGNDNSLFSQSSTTSQKTMQHQSIILPDKLFCGLQDIRISVGWYIPVEIIIEQIKDALDHAYKNYRT